MAEYGVRLKGHRKRIARLIKDMNKASSASSMADVAKDDDVDDV